MATTPKDALVVNPSNAPHIPGKSALPFTTQKHMQIVAAAKNRPDALNTGGDYADEGMPFMESDPRLVTRYRGPKAAFGHVPGLINPPSKNEVDALSNMDESAQGTHIHYVESAIVVDVDAKLLLANADQMRQGIFKEAHYPSIKEYQNSPYYRRLRESQVVLHNIAKLANKTYFNKNNESHKGIILSPLQTAGFKKIDRQIEKQLRESFGKRNPTHNGKRLREGLGGDDFGLDLGGGGFGGSIAANFDMPGNGRDTDFIPLLSGPYNKQLYWFDYLDMHSKAFESWTHNPIAKRIVKLLCQFVLGKGVKATVIAAEKSTGQTQKDAKTGQEFEYVVDLREEAQAILDDHWTRNRMAIRAKEILRDLIIFGEQFIRYFDVPEGKKVRSLDPSTIWEVVTDPDDVEAEFYLHQQYPCLSSKLEIPLLNGKTITVEEMAENWAATKQPVWIYTYDREKKILVPGKAWNVIKVGDKQCVEVILDNDKSFIVSNDHPVLLRDGEYEEASKLKPGQSLMPFDRRLRTIQGHRSKKKSKLYEQVYQPEMDCWEFTHRRVAKEIWKTPKGYVVHHHNLKKLDNEPSNLRPPTGEAHMHEHREMLANRSKRHRRSISEAIIEWHKKNREEFKKTKTGPFYKRTEETNKKMSEVRKKEWADPKQRKERIAAANVNPAQEGQKKYWKKHGYKKRTQRIRELHKDPDWHTKFCEAVSRGKLGKPRNHKVVSVKNVGWYSVYDLTVDILGQKLVSVGKEVHNPIGIVAGGFLGNTRYQWY